MDKQQLIGFLDPLFVLIGEHAYLKALVVVLLSLLFANLLSFILTRVVGSIVRRTHTRLDDSITYFLRTPLYWTVILTGCLVAVDLAGLIPETERVLDAILISFLVVIWATFVVRITRAILVNLSRRQGEQQVVSQQTLPLFSNVALLVVVSVAAYMLFSTWHIDMTAWLASAGIVGIAVGFAAKDTLANLFAGVFILADAPYKIDDYIVLDNGARGKVTQIGLRSTRILTRDDIEVTVPNSIIGNSSVVNESGGPHLKFRVKAPVGVAYGSDIDLVRTVLMEVATAEAQVCEDPEPRVRFRRFGNSALDFELLCWVEDPELRGRVVDSLNCAIYHRFIEHGIEIPYSKHDIYVKDWPQDSRVLPDIG